MANGREEAMVLEHGHSHDEIADRLAAPPAGGKLRDAVYGGMDGAVTTFAIVAGVEGAGLPTAVILALGFANVLADGFSMAAGNFVGTRAEVQDRARLRAIEERHIETVPEGEREELRQILAAKGLSGQVLEDATEAISAQRGVWIEMMLVEEYGVAPTDPVPMRAALVTFVAFLAAGLIPLMPFVLGLDGAFASSAMMTGVVFFAIGSLKSRWSLARWWTSGLETLAIGTVAAALAYGVGSLFDAAL
ncbi:MAG: VIT1/CCC1 transporter family protein [Pseudomonadota bacterium]